MGPGPTDGAEITHTLILPEGWMMSWRRLERWGRGNVDFDAHKVKATSSSTLGAAPRLGVTEATIDFPAQRGRSAAEAVPIAGPGYVPGSRGRSAKEGGEDPEGCP